MSETVAILHDRFPEVSGGETFDRVVVSITISSRPLEREYWDYDFLGVFDE